MSARDSEPAGDVRNEERAVGELAPRAASALVLALVAIGAAFVGGYLFLLVWTGAALWIWWEWTGIVAAAPRRLLLSIGAIAIAGMALSLATDAGAMALIGMVVGAAIVAATAQSSRVWAAGGLVYATAVLVPPVMLRGEPGLGFICILFLFAVVWATDIAAYFSGRLIGGPRLAVRVSPNKTWAGGAGGLVAGVLAGFAVLYAAGVALHAGHLAVLLALVIAAQCGDLIESAIKRKYGVKNASDVIPGHGGLMDRLDGFIAAAVLAVLIGIARGGATAPASGLLAW